jgi:ferric-dicitrate binding protein FerR (iron transport regulator)
LEEKNIRQLLKRYLLGISDEKDQKTVDQWYGSFDAAAPEQLSETESSETRDEIWARIEPAIGFTGDQKKIWSLSRPMKVAAMILLIAGAAGTFLVLKNRSSCPNCAVAYTTISTGIGEKKKVTIQDGSQLTLDAGTTIRIQDDFSHERRIELVDGEVFFDVKKDLEKPFIIHSGILTTTVLGTSFSISAYTALNNLSIGVVSGKVSVAGPSTTLSVLEKDEELVYNKLSKGFKKIPLDESLTAWQEGRILLNDLSFDEIAAIMKKNYGIELATTDDAIRNSRNTTELLSSMTPLEAVQVLAAIHNLQITKKDNKFFLHK